MVKRFNELFNKNNTKKKKKNLAQNTHSVLVGRIG